MTTVILLILFGGWTLYRRFVSVLDVPERKVIFKRRMQGVFLSAVFSILLELMVGKGLLSLDPRLDWACVPAVWLVVYYAFEWMGEEDLKKLGVRTAGALTRKSY